MPLRLALAVALLAAPAAGQVPVGVARADITPAGPIRLSGYGSRTTESEGVDQRLVATALALGDAAPVLLIAADLTGVPARLTEEVAARLRERTGLPRERLTLAVTHTHAAPMVAGYLDNLFGADVPPDQAQRIAAYTEQLTETLVRVGEEALAARAPARLALARSTAAFAANRRTAGGPTDHDVAVLTARDPEGELAALVVNYACHCTTQGGDNNRVCGDWAGYAREALERDHPGARVLVTVGCGGDQNPAPRGTLELARTHGEALAAAVERALAADAAPLASAPAARLATLRLPFAEPRTREEWEARAAQGGAIGYHARKNIARLERGEALPDELALTLQALTFGEDLAWVFLAGEVTVDYALRLKRELDARRLVVTAYANDVPCYIPSERVLAEGGYEAEGAMVYYDQPHRLATGLEQRIVTAVHGLVPDAFRTSPREGGGDGRPPHDPTKTGGFTPLAPEYARRTIEVPAGLEVVLAAAEPLVVDPVAIDFGPDGRLWVCEMRDYPEGMDGAYGPGGRVRVLEDADGDLVFDRATTFLDGLPFPTDVKTWGEGVLVCAAPDILYAVDEDGDGAADRVRRLYTGFATTNYQARVNSLRVGLDGWLHGANGLIGGTVETGEGLIGWRSELVQVELGGRDFRIDPRKGRIELLPGLTQQGRARDDFGEWFGCDNSTLATHYPLIGFDLERLAVAPPPAEVYLPTGEDPNRLFPISPVVRRYNDRPHQGRVTSACGLDLYRDTALGEEYAGDLFVCEPVHNLVRRLEREPRDTTFTAHPAPGEEQREFLASSDPWFRPVQVRTGPDGALWVVDMARWVIEHPRWIDAEMLATVDLRAGADLGRLWRVVRVDGMPARRTRVDDLEGAALGKALDCENGTLRDLAFERILDGWALPSDAMLEMRRALFAVMLEGDRPAGRVAALAALAAGGELSEDLVAEALHDPDARVRAEAARHVYGGGEVSEGDRLTELALEDPDPRVRRNAALAQSRVALPEQLLSSTRRADLRVRYHEAASLGVAVGRALRQGADDPYLLAALLSAAAPRLSTAVEGAFPAGDPPPPEVLSGLLALALARDDLEVAGVLLDRSLSAAGDGGTATLAAFFAALDERGTSVAELVDGAPMALVAALRSARSVVRDAREVALDVDASLAERAAATGLLARLPEERGADAAALAELLHPDQPPPLRRAAVAAVGRSADARFVEVLLAAWTTLGPELVGPTLDAVLARPEGARTFLAYAGAEPAVARAVDPARRRRLFEHPDGDVRRAATVALAVAPTPSAGDELARLAAVDGMVGDAERGREVFEKACSVCHVLDGVGTAVGPDLAALTDRSTGFLLTSIVDPNREVLAPYVEYVVQTRDGRVLGGLLTEESDAHLRLVGQGGEEQVVARDAVDVLHSTGRSFMTEGLTAELEPADVAGLLAYLREPREPRKEQAGNAPAPVRADGNGEWDLSAARAEIYGPSLVFEEPFGDLGYWHGPNDRAVWSVVVDEPTAVDVWLEWACDQASAGSTFELEGAGASWRGTVEGTGAGWSHYRWARIGAGDLPAGTHRFVVRPVGDPAQALFDLRRVRLTPRGVEPVR